MVGELAGWEKTFVKTSDNEYELYYEILVGNDMTKKKKGSFVFQINLATLYHYLGRRVWNPDGPMRPMCPG